MCEYLISYHSNCFLNQDYIWLLNDNTCGSAHFPIILENPKLNCKNLPHWKLKQSGKNLDFNATKKSKMTILKTQ